MTSPHADPAANGHVFGRATVTVDLEKGDCVLIVDDQRYAGKRPRFHSLDEIAGAWMTANAAAPVDPVAGDVARALRFAGQMLKAKQESKP